MEWDVKHQTLNPALWVQIYDTIYCSAVDSGVIHKKMGATQLENSGQLLSARSLDLEQFQFLH